jgi:predicted lipoprotein with Yx(FWY)xxD motif
MSKKFGFWMVINLVMVAALALSSCASAPTATETPTGPAAIGTAAVETDTTEPATPAATDTTALETPTTAAPGDTAVPLATAATSTGDVTLNVAADPTLGNILVDGKGMTLYLYKTDVPGVSNCSADCLKVSPPFVTQGNPILGAGVDSSKVSAAPLADGRKIVTYDGMPLYYYASDTKAGDTTGQGVDGVWFVVTPSP